MINFLFFNVPLEFAIVGLPFLFAGLFASIDIINEFINL